ncbi:baseplate J/gp47 family protein [Thiotrichales bacterium 19S9-12]|nr:baseplate J/gp47 family protein [Thiotrichales bacterium 19S9-11]MCF6812501.1 baseplate J/gp47 family protein [Thiotrichales bacterium 19S9-12]
MKQFDLTSLPLPDVIASVNYDKNFNKLMADFKLRLPEYDVDTPSDPAIKILEACAYGLTLYQQRINDAIKSVLIAYATGYDLEHLGALFKVGRDINEPDERYRYRITNKLEKISTAGSKESYEVLALEADSRVIDAKAFDDNEKPGVAFVVIQSNETTDGRASDELIQTVTAYLTDKKRKPLGTQVIVLSVEPFEYRIIARIGLYQLLDKEEVIETIKTKLDFLIKRYHKIGSMIPLSEIYSQLNIEGVSYVVDLVSPTQSICGSKTQVPYCVEIDISEADV